MESEKQFTLAFQFLDPRQKWIYEELRELIGPGPAAFFRDACWIMANPELLETSAHLVGHCIREIESAIREVLEPIVTNAQVKRSEKDKHKKEIKQLLSAIGISEHDPAAKAWLEIAGKLHSFAHRRSLDKPRSPNEIKELWDNFQTFLYILLQAIRKLYLIWIQTLDNLLSQRQPTEESINKLRHKIPNNIVTRSYFFDRLETPEWLEPLWKKGFFKQPPEPIRNKEEGTIRFPPWPEARYLARMAKYKSELVAQIIKDMEDTENISVIKDLVDAALIMPPEISATLIEKTLKWAKNPYLLHPLPKKLGALIAHWTKGGKADEALLLAEALLEVLPDRRKSIKKLYSLPPKTEIRFDIFDY